MLARSYDGLVVGGGIVGLATALALQECLPGARWALVEKEGGLARHQTGHNSGVLHSGLYYRPGSLKARLCLEGHAAMVAFCQEEGLAHDLCGKLVVATSEDEVPGLEELARRGLANGVPLRRLDGREARELEPEVRCVAALHVTSTGVVDYRQVAEAMGRRFLARGGEIHLHTRVDRIRRTADQTLVFTSRGNFRTGRLVNCAGLFSDRVARAAGARLQARIVPFRGEYYELVPSRRSRVRGLIYPVPNPDFPFLGVHFTRMIDGSVHVGPNAVLAFRREGYTWGQVSPRDMMETLLFPGFWRLARRYAAEGLREMARSLRKDLLVRSARLMLPALRAEDLVPAGAGVRAQALTASGALVDDFLVLHHEGAMHVCNAPSPAATSSLALGRMLAREFAEAPEAPGGLLRLG